MAASKSLIPLRPPPFTMQAAHQMRGLISEVRPQHKGGKWVLGQFNFIGSVLGIQTNFF